MTVERLDPATTALLLVDMQNDFLHADGAYARAIDCTRSSKEEMLSPK